MRQGLMDMAVQLSNKLAISLLKTINVIGSSRPSIFIICENPQDVVKLVEGGSANRWVNIGHRRKENVKVGVVAVDDEMLLYSEDCRLGVELGNSESSN